jgi:hypothetical protein
VVVRPCSSTSTTAAGSVPTPVIWSKATVESSSWAVARVSLGAEFAGGDPGGEVVGQQLLALGHEFLEAGADGWVGPAGGEEQGDQLAVLGQEPVEPCREFRQHDLGGAVGGAGQQPAHLGQEAPLLEDGQDDGVLAVEVVVQQALGDAGGGGDVLDGGAVDAPPDRQSGCPAGIMGRGRCWHASTRREGRPRVDPTGG